VIRQVPAEATRPLRQQVLRPHQRVEEVGFAGDDAEEAAHFAAFEGPEDGAPMVGIASVVPEAPDPPIDASNPAGWWRLRGMATAEDQRRKGLGAALVAAVIDHVARRGGTAVWCNARVPAVGFYRHLGFVTIGEPWEKDPYVGPHITMWRPVSLPPTT
jgi:GNAT superfamily N-acetyltransferase